MINKPSNSKTSHYTNPELVEDLLDITPLNKEWNILDAGSGQNKVWYNSLVRRGYKAFECEIEDGADFFKWDKPVDCIVGNPPYHLITEFTTHIWNNMPQVKCIGWLLNINGFNCMTPKKLETFKNIGMSLSKIHVVADERWFGRYYYLVFNGDKSIISWNTKVYKEEQDETD